MKWNASHSSRRVGLVLAVAAAGTIFFSTPSNAGLFGEDPKFEADYAPQSAFVAHGAVQIGAFTYQPSSTGKLKPYEIYRSPGANILLTQNVSDLVRSSILKELRFIGIHITSGPVLSGEIREFGVDGTSASVSIHYTLTDAQGAAVYQSDKAIHMRLGAGNVSPLDNPMAGNFEALLKDADFIKAIGGSLVSAPLMEPTAGAIPLKYVPSSAFISSGSVAIGAFEYPPMGAEKIDADQVKNSAIGNIHLDRPVANYFAEALSKEFRLIGISVESKDRTLSGTIQSLICDDLGSSATWALVVKYDLKDPSGNVLYATEKTTKVTTQKSLEMLNSVLKRNFEALLLDAEFVSAIGGSANPGNAEEAILKSDGWNWAEWSGYGPRTALSLEGKVSVASFSYPVMKGKMKPTEIPNTALMKTINADKPIAEIMQSLTLNELRSAGVDVTGKERSLSGDIVSYKVDDIADPEEWTIAVHFVVKDNSGNVIYEDTKRATPTNDAHLVNFLEMKTVIEALISDPKFKAAIN